VTTLEVPARPSSAAAVRQRICADLLAAGIAETVIDDVILVATELLSNALRHARALDGDLLGISWDVEGDAVWIKVTDGGGRHHPHVRHPSPDETNGRGLSIVSALAAEWGVEQGDTNATVWATLRV
jgi:serine/threonine-protein kinase RsbW